MAGWGYYETTSGARGFGDVLKLLQQRGDVNPGSPGDEGCTPTVRNGLGRPQACINSKKGFFSSHLSCHQVTIGLKSDIVSPSFFEYHLPFFEYHLSSLTHTPPLLSSLSSQSNLFLFYIADKNLQLIKGPFTYRRPSNNQRQCRPSNKISSINGL